MAVIEKDKDNAEEVEVLYELDVVTFESTVVYKDDLEIAITRVPSQDIYDIAIQNKAHTKIIEYKTTKKLTPTEEKYFNMTYNEELIDDDGIKVKCACHSIEYLF